MWEGEGVIGPEQSGARSLLIRPVRVCLMMCRSSFGSAATPSASVWGFQRSMDGEWGGGALLLHFCWIDNRPMRAGRARRPSVVGWLVFFSALLSSLATAPPTPYPPSHFFSFFLLLLVFEPFCIEPIIMDDTVCGLTDRRVSTAKRTPLRSASDRSSVAGATVCAGAATLVALKASLLSCLPSSSAF